MRRATSVSRSDSNLMDQPQSKRRKMHDTDGASSSSQPRLESSSGHRSAEPSRPSDRDSSAGGSRDKTPKPTNIRDELRQQIERSGKLERQNKHLKRQRSKLEQEIRDFQSRLSDSEDLRTHYAELYHKEQNKIKALKSKLEKELASQRKDFERELTRQERKSSERMRSEQHEIDKLTTQFNKKLDEETRLANENHTLREQLDIKNSECLTLKKDSEESKSRLAFQQKQFKSVIETELNCAICSDIMVDACISATCGHAFCKPCFSEWIRRKPECPICRAEEIAASVSAAAAAENDDDLDFIQLALNNAEQVMREAAHLYLYSSSPSAASYDSTPTQSRPASPFYSPASPAYSASSLYSYSPVFTAAYGEHSPAFSTPRYEADYAQTYAPASEDEDFRAEAYYYSAGDEPEYYAVPPGTWSPDYRRNTEEEEGERTRLRFRTPESGERSYRTADSPVSAGFEGGFTPERRRRREARTQRR